MKYSVTELVHRWFPKFDKQATAERMAARGTLGPKYQGIAPRDASKEEKAALLVKHWEESGSQKARLGTEVHQYIEDFYTLGTPLPNIKEAQLFLEFHNHTLSQGFLAFLSEQNLYSKEYNLAGCADMLYLYPDSPRDKPKLWLVDWKRSEQIKIKAFKEEQTGYGVLSDKPACNFEEYSFQLNIYAFLLETYYSVTIARMSLVILHPRQYRPEVLEVSRNRAAVEKILVIEKY